MKRKKIISVILILLAASGWGMIGVFTRPLSGAGLNVIQITFIRSIIVAVGMGLFLLFRDASLLRIKVKDIWMFLGTGLVSIIFFNACYFLTIEHTTLAAASVLLYTAPCFVMLMSACFFREKITLQKLAALVLAFAGCILASGFAGGDIGTLVLLTGIGAGLGYASYSIFVKVALKKYQTFTIVFYTFAIAVIGLLPFCQITVIVSGLANDFNSLAAGLGLGVLSTLIPYIFYTGGLTYVEAGTASVLAFAEPMVAAVAGIIIFEEPLYPRNAAGILLIFLAIVLLNIPVERRESGETGG